MCSSDLFVNFLFLTEKGKKTFIYSFILSNKSIILKRVQVVLIIILFISYKIVMPYNVKETRDTNKLSNTIQKAIEIEKSK